MRALKTCHSSTSYAKFLGMCNDQKHALNLCLRGEVRPPFYSTCPISHFAPDEVEERAEGGDADEWSRGLQRRMTIMRLRRRSERRLRINGSSLMRSHEAATSLYGFGEGEMEEGVADGGGMTIALHRISDSLCALLLLLQDLPVSVRPL